MNIYLHITLPNCTESHTFSRYQDSQMFPIIPEYLWSSGIPDVTVLWLLRLHYCHIKITVCLKRLTYKWISAYGLCSELFSSSHETIDTAVQSCHFVRLRLPEFFHSLRRAKAIRMVHRSPLFKFAWGILQNLHLGASQTAESCHISLWISAGGKE